MITLKGIKNNRYRYELTIEKNQENVKKLIKFLKELEFKNSEFNLLECKKGIDICVPIKISKIDDKCIYFRNKRYDLDLFYGNKRIILVIRTKNSSFLKTINQSFKFKK